mmetsp:Transcript_28585/g.36928  ORF Transcript_28585/g.36928 Transcript_28585/m.36928 type:complete len:1093 (-) Transcript_28585:313-3591(-)
MKSYMDAKGYAKKNDFLVAMKKWGLNSLHIPVTPFFELFKDHLVAPFFVFQVLCVLLWMLDEYWYYSLWTLVMLLIFEAAVCKQRQGSLEFVRGMRRPPYQLFVYRLRTWQLASSLELLPGDICSLRTQRIQAGVGGNSDGGNNAEDEHYVPADMLLLKGNCVVNEAMLTGESVPQVKTSVGSQSWGKNETLVVGENADGTHKRCVVFAGTNIIQNSPESNAGGCKIPPPPDHGCIAFVLRTGFETSQGNLMRTILFSQKKMVVGDKDTGLFIAILVFFALVASVNVLVTGLEDPRRNKFKLVLHCIMIVTTVVPPELPMELSMAVSNSLNALMRQLIYCTEPFRIPFAGKINVCCFDKTGTLTSDELVLLGVAEQCSTSPAEEDEVTSPNALGIDAVRVLTGCHSLVSLSGQLIGDPLEKATLAGIGYTCQGDGYVVPDLSSSSSDTAVLDQNVSPKILKRFAFTSEKRRMATIVQAPWKNDTNEDSNQTEDRYWVLVKGAPEALETLYEQIPAGYCETFMHHMSKGRRVLALGYKLIDKEMKFEELMKLDQEEVEGGLQFAGFLTLNCPLKYDTIQVLDELQTSRHKTVMITGDSPFTAADVALQIGMINQTPDNVLILDVVGSELSWKNLAVTQQKSGSELVDIPFKPGKVSKLASSNELCVTGGAIHHIVKENFHGEEGVEPVLTPSGMAILKQLCPHVMVFARMSPTQKEVVIAALNACGLVTLMCGDGTNDVGALKRAHCGVSILNCPELEKRLQKTHKKSKKKASKLSGKSSSSGMVRKRRSSKTESSKDTKTKASKNEKERGTSVKKKKKKKGMSAMAKLMAEMQEQEKDPRLVRLGDASVASPFTAKRISTDCVLAIVRQGRCTLVTTLQMYKILALNCLVGAYMLSSLYVYGIKQGDFQMVALGISVAVLFFAVSRAKPLEKLSAQRPPTRIFCWAVGTSVLLQFLIHLGCLFAAVKLCTDYIPSTEDPFLIPDGPFYPNTLNTVIYLLSAVIQTNNFSANYTGHPFMQGIRENRLMWYIILAMYATFLIVATESFEPLSDLLQLSPMPSDSFRTKVLCILAGDTILSIGVERCLRRFFVDK